MRIFSFQKSDAIARRGSVLIMVIAVLVLMALIGTAYVSVARIDRQAAATGTSNTEMNLLTSGVSQQVDSLVLGGVFATIGGQSYYRPATDTGGASYAIQSTDATVVYHDYDSPLDDRDAWLASRIPEPLVINTTAVTAISTANPPVWPSVSLMTNAAMSTIATGYTVDVPNGNSIQLGGTSGGLYGATDKLQYRFEPTYTTVGAATYPAMTILESTIPATPTTVLAADADGDGIADSLYFKLANQPDAGITYYGAVRIVDSNSAMNASTAWSLRNDFDGSTAGAPSTYITANLGTFASNVGLEEMLRTYNSTASPPDSTEMDNLTNYRFNWAAPYSLVNSNSTWPDLSLAPPPAQSKPFNDPDTLDHWQNYNDQRSDYYFITYGEMLQMGLARRQDNPGYNNIGNVAVSSTSPPRRFQSLAWTDSAALAYHFCIPASNYPSSTIENELPQSLLQNVGADGTLTFTPTTTNWTYAIGYATASPTAYPSSYVWTAQTTNTRTNFWYNDNFDFDDETFFSGAAADTKTYRPLRALLVAESPTSDNVPNDNSITAEYTNSAANRPTCRANVNTSSYNDLLNAFWAVMNRCDTTSLGSTGPTHAFDPFTTNIPSPLTTAADVQHLRGALAAVNTISLRGNDYPVSATSDAPYQVSLKAAPASSSTFVYGLSYQPFITEVVIDEYTGSPSYIAMKIYNPTPVPMDISGWKLVTFASGSTLQDPLAGYAFPGVTTIPAGSFIVIDNGAPPPAPPTDGTNTPTNKPLGLNPPGGGVTRITIPGWAASAATRWLLIRPVKGQSIANVTALTPQMFAPVDQVDLSQYAPLTTANTLRLLLYHRPVTNYQYVYAGSAANLAVAAAASPSPATLPLPGAGNTTGTTDTWTIRTFELEGDGTLHSDLDVTTFNADMALGNITWAESDTTTVTTSFPISLGFDEATFPGPNSIAAAGSKFPFHGFARDGDILNIPFIGSYVMANGTTMYAINGISFDSSYAEDGDTSPTNLAAEVVGHFCPIGDPTSAVASTKLDYDTGTQSAGNNTHRYWFSRFLFDYVGAISTPDSDYSPNVDPNGGIVTPQAVVNNPNLHPTSAGDNTSKSTWANRDYMTSPPAYDNEYDQPNNGLININTAPWPVLAMLPMVPSNGTAGGIDQANNTALAKAIVRYRNTNGPFTSIFDLNRVVNYTNAGAVDNTHTFQNGWDTLTMGAAGEPDENERDFTNAGTFPRWTNTSTLPLAINKNEAKNLHNMITRISNLVTTRSDSFTVYIVVEGWKNAGSSAATRVSQTRQAYIVDRSHVNGLNKTLNIIPVPTN